MPTLQTYCNIKTYLQKVDSYTESMWLIHGTKHRKDKQLQTWNTHRKYPIWQYTFNTQKLSSA